MKGAILRLIKKHGLEYDVLNAADTGGRELPDYQKDGTIKAVLERRGTPRTVTDTDGTDAETDLEVRAIVEDSDPDINAASATDSHPTLLEHPNGRQYRVLHSHDEDGPVSVMSVMED